MHLQNTFVSPSTWEQRHSFHPTNVWCFHLQAYDVVVIRNVKQKHALARKYFSQIPEMAKCLHDTEIQPAALSNLLVSKPITNATK